MKTKYKFENKLEIKHIPIFTFEDNCLQNALVHPKWQASLNEYCIFIRDHISKHPRFECYLYRNKKNSGIKLILSEESSADLNFTLSGYSHIPLLTQKDLSSFNMHGFGTLKSTCHFMDSVDMFHMANFLVNSLDLEPECSIEKTELAIMVSQSYNDYDF